MLRPITAACEECRRELEAESQELRVEVTDEDEQIVSARRAGTASSESPPAERLHTAAFCPFLLALPQCVDGLAHLLERVHRKAAVRVGPRLWRDVGTPADGVGWMRLRWSVSGGRGDCV